MTEFTLLEQVSFIVADGIDECKEPYAIAREVMQFLTDAEKIGGMGCKVLDEKTDGKLLDWVKIPKWPGYPE